MRPLLVSLATIASALSVAPAASGAPLCHLVTDKLGDQAVLVQGTSALVSPDLDIRSGDVAVDARHVVAVIRLASLQRFDARYPASRVYSLRFGLETDTNDRTYSLNALVSPTDVTAWLTGPPGGYQDATVAVDYTRAEVKIATPVSHFGKPPLNRGRELRDIEVTTEQHFGGPPRRGQVGPITSGGSSSGFGVTADEAVAARSYRGGTPTCVAMPR